jgi:hypothetical protein
MFSLKLFRTYKHMINRGNIPTGERNILLQGRKSKRKIHYSHIPEYYHRKTDRSRQSQISLFLSV